MLDYLKEYTGLDKYRYEGRYKKTFKGENDYQIIRNEFSGGVWKKNELTEEEIMGNSYDRELTKIIEQAEEIYKHIGGLYSIVEWGYGSKQLKNVIETGSLFASDEERKKIEEKLLNKSKELVYRQKLLIKIDSLIEMYSNKIKRLKEGKDKVKGEKEGQKPGNFLDIDDVSL